MAEGNFKYEWVKKGDLNAFFGLMLDNMTGLVILASLLISVFHLPADIVLLRMVPGTAFGIMLGDLAYSYMAFQLAKKEKRQDVCAMPLGIDSIALFGLTLGVIGPAFIVTQSAEKAWAVGMAVLIMMGIAKIITAFFGEAIRRAIPRSALLGSIGTLAICLIAFLPFIKIFQDPIPGLLAFGVILMTFVAKVKLPADLPGAFAAVAVGTIIYYISKSFGFSPAIPSSDVAVTLSLPMPTTVFLGGLSMAFNYLPLAIPIAISNVIGGIDNTESAAVAGDKYNTRDILLVEGVATLIAGLFGGVIQNTPYIGHPAYKRMGGRAAYTIATGLFIGIGAMLGVVGWLITVLPESVLVPILVFIGLEVITQAYSATDKKYLPAVSICFIPILAYLLQIHFNQFIGAASISFKTIRPDFQATINTINILANGFIVTAMVWSTMLTQLIDQKLKSASATAVLASLLTVVGFIHSPYPGGKLFLPSYDTPAIVYQVVAGYLLMSLTFFVVSHLNSRQEE